MPTSHPISRWFAVVIVFSVVAVACGGSDETTTTTTPTTAEAADTTTVDATTSTAPPVDEPVNEPPLAPPTDYAGFREQPTACGGELPAENPMLEFDAPEDLGIDPETRPTATLVTSCGDIVIELDPSIAPETVNSFVFLATNGYYDGTAAHRVLPGFVFQAGDPTATGRGNPGYFVPDEYPAEPFSYELGVVAMANAGPGSTGSQFFIVLETAPGLPPEFTVFGEVVDGEDTLDAISLIPMGANAVGEPSVPLESLYIETVTIDGL